MFVRVFPRAATAACFVFFFAFARPGAACGAGAGIATPLTLEQALARAQAANPRLAALAWDLRKADGRVRQAGAGPNPLLNAEVENAGASGTGTEATVSLAQTVELGGKRDARVAAARAEREVQALDVAAERRALIGEVTSRFLESLAAERSLQLSDEEIHAAEEAAATNAQRVRAGAAHPVEKRRADVELASLRLERTIRQSDAELARSRLSATWGEIEPGFAALAGSLDSVPAVPDLAALRARAEAAPGLGRWRAERDARQKRVDLERARGTPDVTPMAGVRSLNDGADATWIAGVSLPLPIFDRNRGAIDEATAALGQAQPAEAQARLELHRALAEAQAALRRSRDRVDAIRREVLPEAARAFDEIRAGYELGRFNYLDLLEARRTWLRARREELQSLLAAHLAFTELERLAGAPLGTVPEGGPRR